MKRILDPAFRYVPSHATDVAKTFARIRREQKQAQAQAQTRPTATIQPLKQRTKA